MSAMQPIHPPPSIPRDIQAEAILAEVVIRAAVADMPVAAAVDTTNPSSISHLPGAHASVGPGSSPFIDTTDDRLE
jgi:hypothetical protein